MSMHAGSPSLSKRLKTTTQIVRQDDGEARVAAALARAQPCAGWRTRRHASLSDGRQRTGLPRHSDESSNPVGAGTGSLCCTLVTAVLVETILVAKGTRRVRRFRIEHLPTERRLQRVCVRCR